MKNNTEISGRITELIDFIGVSKNDFAKHLGYSRSQTIYDIVKGKAKPSFDFFQKLLNSEYSEKFNLEYIITGRGSLTTKNDNNHLPVKNSNSLNNSKEESNFNLLPIEEKLNVLFHSLNKELHEIKKENTEKIDTISGALASLLLSVDEISDKMKKMDGE